MPTDPRSEHDWTIHSINIHGVFFERWCQSIVNTSGRWRVTRTNYPVEYPPAGGAFLAQESALDIGAEYPTVREPVFLLIECKKNNPDLVNWVFFPKHYPSETDTYFVNQIECATLRSDPGTWRSRHSFAETTRELIITDEARETRSRYGSYKGNDKTKTSNAAVSSAARQIALATQALLLEELVQNERLRREPSGAPTPYRRKYFVPAIVTTAQLLVCRFKAEDVDPKTGEIEYANATLEPAPYLIYEYPLPPALQADEDDDGPRRDYANRPALYVRMHILVVQSESLGTLLPELPSVLNIL